MPKNIPATALRQRVDALSPEQLTEFAYDVAFVLYGTFFNEGDDSEDFPPDAKDGEAFVNQDEEWTGDHIEMVDGLVRALNLNPDALQQ